MHHLNTIITLSIITGGSLQQTIIFQLFQSFLKNYPCAENDSSSVDCFILFLFFILILTNAYIWHSMALSINYTRQIKHTIIMTSFDTGFIHRIQRLFLGISGTILVKIDSGNTIKLEKNPTLPYFLFRSVNPQSG